MTSDAEPTEGATAPPSRRRGLLGRLRWLAPLALGLLGSVAGLVLFTSFLQPRQQEPLTPQAVSSVVAKAIATARNAPARSTEVYSHILPSLVLIRTEGQRAGGTGIGSGVIINENGTVLTANHVIEGATVIRLTFADGSEATARVLNSLPAEDLALLESSSLPELVVPATLGGGANIGDETYAVGNPLGLAASLSAGVVSGLNRTIPIPRTGIELKGLIQFDAAVNPGSSGGPLLNRNGEVIGIVTALANPGGGSNSFTGIGFAVPLGSGGGLGGPPR